MFYHRHCIVYFIVHIAIYEPLLQNDQYPHIITYCLPILQSVSVVAAVKLF